MPMDMLGLVHKVFHYFGFFRYTTLPMLSSARHILIIQPLVGIGDMIWHKPWIDALIADYQVTLATKPTVQAPIIFHGTPASFQLMMIERSLRGKRGRHDGLSGFWRLVRDFRASGADTAIILHHSTRYAIAAWLAGIKTRLGYGRKGQQKYLNTGHYLFPSELKQHAVSRIRQFAARNGFGLDNPAWHITLPKEAHHQAEAYLKSAELISEKGQTHPYLCLGIGAMHPERQWGSEKFSQLITGLYRARPDMRIALIAGPQDEDIITEIKHHLPAHPDIPAPLIIRDRLDVACAVMARAEGYVGNDTSLLNLSVCVGRPALGLFSQSEPLDYSPLIHQLNLFPASAYGTKGLIHKISTEAVLEAVLRLWPEIK